MEAQVPSYLGHIRNKLVQQYGPKVVDLGGLDVMSAMDLNLQTLAEKTLSEGVKKNSPTLQGALICLDPATGDVLAAVGGVDATLNGYNRAFYAKRQPGSSIKPLIYAAALDTGLTPTTVMNDTPVAYPRGNGATWKPLNYEKKAYGELTLREALAHSNNVIAVKLLDGLGVPNFITFAGRMGLSLNTHPDLSLALGTEEVTLNELVAAYTPFANGGQRAEPRTIVRVYDRYRRTWTENPPAVTPVLAPATAYVMTQMMKDVMVYGTAKGLKKFSQERPMAGKTGTTDDYRDAWFVGYTPQLITGVWVGYDKPKPGGKGFTGGGISAPIWSKFMHGALASKPVADFPKPENVVTAVIDKSSGYLATPECQDKREEYYIAGTEPTQYCPEHGGDRIAPVTTPAVAPPAEAGTEAGTEAEPAGDAGDAPAAEGEGVTETPASPEE